jgi:hypothetical protein
MNKQERDTISLRLEGYHAKIDYLLQTHPDQISAVDQASLDETIHLAYLDHLRLADPVLAAQEAAQVGQAHQEVPQDLDDRVMAEDRNFSWKGPSIATPGTPRSTTSWSQYRDSQAKKAEEKEEAEIILEEVEEESLYLIKVDPAKELSPIGLRVFLETIQNEKYTGYYDEAKHCYIIAGMRKDIKNVKYWVKLL